jgi:hypothetical protein
MGNGEFGVVRATDGENKNLFNILYQHFSRRCQKSAILFDVRARARILWELLNVAMQLRHAFTFESRNPHHYFYFGYFFFFFFTRTPDV